MENQLSILSESLSQKIEILRQIEELNEEQTQAFSGEEADVEKFDHAFEEKDRLIDQLERLDEGFELLYDRLADELKENRLRYRSQISVIQEKIREITERSVSIQAQEARNKKLVEDYLVKARAGIRQNRQNSKAAYDYYRNMSGASYRISSSWDSKQ